MANTLAELNDDFRRSMAGGHVVVTAGIANRCDLTCILLQVSVFDAFTVENDPHGEHDFGAFDHGGETFFWKIDYYDRSLSFGSPDPMDSEVTTRMLTVMLASEY